MKLFTRVVLFVVLALTLAAPVTAFAQEQPCYGLDQESCDLMYNMGPEDFSSFAMSYTFNMSVAGGDSDIVVASDGSGSFSLVKGAEDPLKSFNMAMNINSSSSSADGEDAGSFEFRIIDGNFYMSEDDTVWVFFSLEKAMDKAMESGQMPFDFRDMMAGGVEGMAGMEEMAGMAGQLGPLADMANSYISATREDVDGQAHITVSLDLAGLLADPDLGTGVSEMLMNNPQMLAGMGAGMGGGMEMTEEELEQSAQMLGMMLPMVGMMFTQAELDYTAKATVEDSAFAGFAIHMAMTIDPSMMGMGGESDVAVEPVEILFDMDVDVWDYNAEFNYEVPEGATEEEL